MDNQVLTALCVLSIGIGVMFLIAAPYAIFEIIRDVIKFKRSFQKPTKAEEKFAEWIYERPGSCGCCIHCYECNDPERHVEGEERPPKEKCIAGIIDYTRLEAHRQERKR